MLQTCTNYSHTNSNQKFEGGSTPVRNPLFLSNWFMTELYFLRLVLNLATEVNTVCADEGKYCINKRM